MSRGEDMRNLLLFLKKHSIFFILCTIMVLAYMSSRLNINQLCVGILCFQLATQKTQFKQIQIIILIILVMWI